MIQDPFAHIPDHPKVELGERGSTGKKVDPFGTAPKRRAKVSTETLTRELWRKRGYFYGRTETLESHYGGQFSVKKDLFGIVDGIAVGNGEVVFLQSTTKLQKSAHLQKLIKSTWKIGNGTPTRIVGVVRQIIASGSRLVFCLWEQPGGFGSRWECEELEITAELLGTLEARAARRARAGGPFR